MKKLSQNGKPKWESRIRNLFDYPFDTAKVHTKVESTKYISSFFSYKSRTTLRFFPSRGLYPSEVREKTYTSLTTPGLYFISSRKCEIAQSAIYQKIIRRLKLFLNIMFVKFPPQQFSVHFFTAHRHFSRRTPRKTSFCRHSLAEPHHLSTTPPGIFFFSPAASTRRPPRWASRFGTSFTRWARNCASLLTAHRTLPRRARKMGSYEGKIGGFHPKMGVFRSKHPRFYPPACTHTAQARTKKGLHPNSFVQSFIF